MLNYNINTNLSSNTIANILLDQITIGSSVLLLNCSYESVIKYLYEEKHCSIFLVETNKQFFDFSKKYIKDGICADISSQSWQSYYAEKGSQFDYIIFDEICEDFASLTKPFLRENSVLLYLDILSQSRIDYQDRNIQYLSKKLNDSVNNQQSMKVALQNYAFVDSAYQDILHSRSWRITAPLRSFMPKLRKIRVYRWASQIIHHVRSYGVKATIRKILSKFKSKFSKKTTAQISPVYPENGAPFSSMEEMLDACRVLGGSIQLDEKHTSNTNKNRVLLVSHELNLTGAPVAVESMAEALQAMGKEVIVISPHDGALRKRFTDKNIPTIVLEQVYSVDLVRRSMHLFESIVVSTNVGAPLIRQLSGYSTPVLWWIHEARASYFKEAVDAMPEFIDSNIHVYCGGDYAQRLLHEYRPSYQSNILLYAVPDHADTSVSYNTLDLSDADGKTLFAIVGMLEHRKGQDIFAEAIRLLPKHKIEQSYFVFVGKQNYPPCFAAIQSLCEEYPDNIRYIEQLNREELIQLYQRMDCLVCTSRDDPMPIVVSDAMSLSKCIICSENTGSATLLQQMSAGIIYHNDNPVELSYCLEKVLSNSAELQFMKTQARKTFEAHFTKDVFVSNLKNVYDILCPSDLTLTNIPLQYHSVNNGSYRAFYNDSLLTAFDNNEKKNILLFSHELSLTGAPLVLYYTAKILRAQGNNVVVLSPVDGPLRESYVNAGFPVILFEDVYNSASNDFLPRYGAIFDIIFINTIVPYKAVTLLCNSSTPVVWWVHDSHISYRYFENVLPQTPPCNVRVLGGGYYAKKQLVDHYPHYQVEEFLYAIDDCSKAEIGTPPVLDRRGRKLFLIVGTLEWRKGQDIAVEAIRSLPEEITNNCLFLFIGKDVDKNIAQTVDQLCEESPAFVSRIMQLSHKDLRALYREADCLICPSRDDPMPVVVTEMQALSKAVICSENTGSASLIQQYGGGLLYRNNDPLLLAKEIQNFYFSPVEAIMTLGQEARTLYETCFSEQSFAKALSTLTDDLLRPVTLPSVSVIIPTFNAGEQFREMLERLNAQESLHRLEIIVVDSGSTDGTQQVALDAGANLIQITQEQFSHSFSRNLGAKNASGQVLLFMTQDALPSHNRWIYEMAMPIFNNEASAVTCREQCPDSIDLHYNILSWNHSCYIGINKASQLNRLGTNTNNNTLRQMASLNDVSTAIDRTQFMRMGGYRHSFAEDLDMGIRLLREGKCLKLLHEPTVIHGHHRPASYYLRRGFAEGRAVEQMLDLPIELLPSYVLSEEIVTGYRVLQNALLRIRKKTSISSIDEYVKLFNKYVRQEMKSVSYTTTYNGIGSDKMVENCIRTLETIWDKQATRDFKFVTNIMHYCNYIVPVYCKDTNCNHINFAEKISDCIYKHTALIMGTFLSHMNDMDPFYQQFKSLAKGI